MASYLGSIDTSGGTGGGGNISIYNCNYVGITGAYPYVHVLNGTVQPDSGTFTPVGFNTGAINTGDLTAYGDITIQFAPNVNNNPVTLGNIQANNITITGGQYSLTTGNITGGYNQTGSINIQFSPPANPTQLSSFTAGNIVNDQSVYSYQTAGGITNGPGPITINVGQSGYISAGNISANMLYGWPQPTGNGGAINITASYAPLNPSLMSSAPAVWHSGLYATGISSTSTVGAGGPITINTYGTFNIGGMDPSTGIGGTSGAITSQGSTGNGNININVQGGPFGSSSSAAAIIVSTPIVANTLNLSTSAYCATCATSITVNNTGTAGPAIQTSSTLSLEAQNLVINGVVSAAGAVTLTNASINSGVFISGSGSVSTSGTGPQFITAEIPNPFTMPIGMNPANWPANVAVVINLGPQGNITIADNSATVPGVPNTITFLGNGPTLNPAAGGNVTSSGSVSTTGANGFWPYVIPNPVPPPPGAANWPANVTAVLSYWGVQGPGTISNNNVIVAGQGTGVTVTPSPAGGSVILSSTSAAGETLAFTSGSVLNVGTPGASLNTSGLTGPLTVAISGGGTATIQNNGLPLSFSPPAGQPVTFAGSGTFNFKNSPVTISTTTSGDITVQAGVTLKTTNSLVLQSAGNLNVYGNLLGSPVKLATTSGAGNVTVGGNVTASGGGNLTVTAAGAGNIVSTGGLLSGALVALSSGTGNIGTATAPIHTAGQPYLQAVTGGAGNVYLNQTGAATLINSSAGGIFSLVSNAPVTLSGTQPLTGSSVYINTQSSPAGTITANVNITATNLIQLQAGGKGNIVQGSGVVFTAPLINLSSGTGTIGTRSSPIITSANTLTVNTSGTGHVFIYNNGSLNLGPSSGGSGLIVLTSGTLYSANTYTTQSGEFVLAGGVSNPFTYLQGLNLASTANIATLTIATQSANFQLTSLLGLDQKPSSMPSGHSAAPTTSGQSSEGGQGAESPNVTVFEGNVAIFNVGPPNVGDKTTGNEVVAYGDEDTMISRDQSEFYLHLGKLTVDSGKQGLTVKTRDGDIHVAPETTAIINASGSRVDMRVIGGSSREAVSFVPGGTSKPVYAQAGQRVVVDDSDNEEDLISANGTDEAVDASMQIIQTHKVAVASFSVDRYMEREVTLAGRTIRFREAPRELRDRVSEHLIAATKVQKGNGGGAATHDWISAITAGGPAHSDRPINLLAEQGTKIVPVGKEINLNEGAVFLRVLSADTKINTPLGTISATPGALLDLEFKKGVMRVRDCSMQVITIRHGKHVLTLSAGQEVDISATNLDQAQLLADDGIGRRNVRVEQLDKTTRALYCEFSMPSFIALTQHLNSVRHPASLEEKSLHDQLYGTAVKLSVVNASHGRFEQPPKNTSWLPPQETGSWLR
jgi:hypothetical protein